MPRIVLFLILTGLVSSVFIWQARGAPQEPAPSAKQPDLIAHGLAALRKELAQSGKSYLPFVDEASMSMGLYHLLAGSEDKQSPHQLDEVYYVIEGKAMLRVGDELRAAAPGDVLFVRRHAVHRFEEISEDLLLLVVFCKAEPRAKEKTGSGGR